MPIKAILSLAFMLTVAGLASAESKASKPTVDFNHQVMPIINRLGCNQSQCHGAPMGKGGLRLSMFGTNPQDDYDALTKEVEGRRINRIEPLGSLVLLKASAAISHGGGRRMELGSSDYETLAAWLKQGAIREDPRQPKLVSIKATPAEQTIARGETSPLRAMAVFADGAQRDVTRDVTFKSLDAKVASVDSAGTIKAEGYGQTAVVIAYLRRSAVVRVIVPRPLASGFPKIEPNNKIDELVFSHLKRLGITPSPVCTDEVFLRRVYLDTLGMLPTPGEAKAFLADRDPQKRSKLIDRLLDRDEFADFWAMKWGDLLRIKSEFPVRIWPKAVQAYYRWVRDSIARNMPYDQFVRELLTSRGSNFRSGPANFFRAVPTKDAQTIAETTALVFMGARIGCARCHGHPSEDWSLDDDLGMAGFFGRVSFKSTQEWKEEIVCFNPKGVVRDPKTKKIVKPKFLGGKPLELDPQEDPREKFVGWLLAPENPWFAKNIVNRTWSWLLGRGIVHEPDDLRPTNPPSNPELLDYLSAELVSHKYDLKHVFRIILNSKTYQLSSEETEGNKGDVVNFSHYQIKRLGAEQLLDAVDRVTETPETFASKIPEPFTRLPADCRAVQIADANIESSLLDLFGRPPRDTPYERERYCELSMRQSLYFVNSDNLDAKVAASGRLKRVIKEKQPDAKIVEEVFLAALSRFPTQAESKRLADYLAKNKKSRDQALRDVVWAVLNTNEFLFNH